MTRDQIVPKMPHGPYFLLTSRYFLRWRTCGPKPLVYDSREP